MMRITLHIKQSTGVWRLGVLLICLFLTLSAAGSTVARERSTGPQDESGGGFIPRSTGRHFYLTDASYATDQALNACAVGYHMASLWEILDVSNLIYDYDHPAAHVKADSGHGPPSYWHGWVRTGWSSSGSTVTGTGNCMNWSSINGADSGVSVRLSRAWETAPGDISTWDANSFACNFTGPVWCVGDFFQSFLPVILKGH